jgi:tyrosyl-tRNA synthetase
MEDYKKGTNENEKEIVFSQAIKAGKRIYYIDVKKNRKDEMYLSITESKKIVSGEGENSSISFEKHKIFLYREDLEKFLEAFTDAAQFAIEKQPAQPRYSRNDENPIIIEEEVEEATSETEVEKSEEIKLGELEF